MTSKGQLRDKSHQDRHKKHGSHKGNGKGQTRQPAGEGVFYFGKKKTEKTKRTQNNGVYGSMEQ